RRLPYQPVRGPVVKLHIAYDLRLDPAHALFRAHWQRVAERRARRRDFLQRLVEIARLFVRIARADATGVHELAVLVITEHQGADGTRRDRRRHVADDDELLAQHALALEPILATPGTIRHVHALRDDTLQAESAGMLQHGRPVLGEMLAEADRRGGRQRGDDLLQQRLAVYERCRGEVVTFGIKQIEQIIDEAVLAIGA